MADTITRIRKIPFAVICSKLIFNWIFIDTQLESAGYFHTFYIVHIIISVKSKSNVYFAENGKYDRGEEKTLYVLQISHACLLITSKFSFGKFPRNFRQIKGNVNRMETYISRIWMFQWNACVIVCMEKHFFVKQVENHFVLELCYICVGGVDFSYPVFKGYLVLVVHWIVSDVCSFVPRS